MQNVGPQEVVGGGGAPGRPTGFTPYPAKDSLFGLFLEQAESWYTGYRAISS